MPSSKLEQGRRRTRPWHQKLALAALGTLAISVVWVAAGGATAVTAHSAPRVTVAAIDPALTTCRGANHDTAAHALLVEARGGYWGRSAMTLDSVWPCLSFTATVIV